MLRRSERRFPRRSSKRSGITSSIQKSNKRVIRFFAVSNFGASTFEWEPTGEQALALFESLENSLKGSCASLHLRDGCRSVVQEYHVLCDGLAANIQLIAREIRVGITDRQTANDRKFCWDRQLRADDFGIPRY